MWWLYMKYADGYYLLIQFFYISLGYNVITAESLDVYG